MVVVVDQEWLKAIHVAGLRMLDALDFPGVGNPVVTISSRLRAMADDATELDAVGVAESRLRAALDARPAPMPWRVPGRTPLEKWIALAETFPSLRECPEVRTGELATISARAGTNEMEGMYGAGKGHAARFVLSLFRGASFPAFDVIAAMSRWDGEHRAAFVAWASDPWWP
jgi:hypothetical protein